MRARWLWLALALLCVPAEAQVIPGFPPGAFDNTAAMGASAACKFNATIDYNFAAAVYCGDPSLADLSITNSGGTDLLPTSASGASYNIFGSNTLRITSGLGVLKEEDTENFFLHSTSPATQTISVANGNVYILSVNGPGSATMSAGTATGCGASTATNGNPVVVTITGSGTCVVTISGTLYFVQFANNLNTNSSVATSFIVTAGSPVTRSSDLILWNPPSGTLATVASFYVRGTITANASNGIGEHFLAGLNLAGVEFLAASATKVRMINKSGATRGDSGGVGTSLNTGSNVEMAMAYSASTLIGSLNGATVTLSSPPSEVDLALPLSIGGKWNGSGENQWCDCYIAEAGLATTKLSQATLNSWTSQP